MKFLITILAALFLLGCNPVKKLLKNKAQYNALGTQWMADHPYKIDTTMVVLQSDTVTVTNFKADTIYSNLPSTIVNDTVYNTIQKIITQYQTKNNYIHDTVLRYLQNVTAIENVEKQKAESEKQQVKSETKAKTFLWLMVALALIVLLLLILFTKKR